MQPFGKFSVQGLRRDIIERAADHKHKTAARGCGVITLAASRRASGLAGPSGLAGQGSVG